MSLDMTQIREIYCCFDEYGTTYVMPVMADKYIYNRVVLKNPKILVREQYFICNTPSICSALRHDPVSHCLSHFFFYNVFILPCFSCILFFSIHFLRKIQLIFFMLECGFCFFSCLCCEFDR